MPNCFQLVSKKTGEAEVLARIDEMLCAHLGVPIDPKEWVYSWYDIIGFSLAMGRTFEDLRQTFSVGEEDERSDHERVMLRIVEFLDKNFTTEAWAER